MRHSHGFLSLALSVALLGCADDITDVGEVAADVTFAKVAEGQKHGGHLLQATLLGANEVPGPGDPDGTGTARVTLNHGKRQVCFHLAVEGIDPATSAHIHRGAAGTSGGPVVTLTPPTSGEASGCIDDVAGALIKEIRDAPSNFYVNVHNSGFPAGALRGQLSE